MATTASASTPATPAATTATADNPTANPKALRYFTSRNASRADIFSDPKKLKKAFADAVSTAYNRSEGASYDVNGGSEARLYHEALSMIYNISDYSPPGWRAPNKE